MRDERRIEVEESNTQIWPEAGLNHDVVNQLVVCWTTKSD